MCLGETILKVFVNRIVYFDINIVMYTRLYHEYIHVNIALALSIANLSVKANVRKLLTQTGDYNIMYTFIFIKPYGV